MPGNDRPPSKHPVRKRQWPSIARRVLGALVSVALFVLSLILMKEGAGPLAPFIRNTFSVDSPASALGFGWLSANIALSGSPVAATSLTLLDAKVLSMLEAFAMVAGSRLGAAFIVLLVGFVYMLRGKHRDLSLSVGLLSLLVTQTIYPFVLLLGFSLLSSSFLQSWQLQANPDLNSPFEVLLRPLLVLLETMVPAWFLFPAGFLLILFSLWLFDKVVPEVHLEETRLGMVHHVLYRPAVTFVLGAVITSLTMSVSVSLSLLVPLSVRGYVRRENVIPYILGANITTFIDTLIAAALLANPAAVTVVLVQIISVTVVSLLILLVGFRFYERFLERLVSFLGHRRQFLVAYVVTIFLFPFALIIFG
ncbi:MAG: hypothetical protein JW726_00445 [Anaerolineales bacterium]|nr:hypothetical protein [Anaerolineales bacterium]